MTAPPPLGVSPGATHEGNGSQGVISASEISKEVNPVIGRSTCSIGVENRGVQRIAGDRRKGRDAATAGEMRSNEVKAVDMSSHLSKPQPVHLVC